MGAVALKTKHVPAAYCSHHKGAVILQRHKQRTMSITAKHVYFSIKQHLIYVQYY
jgi:hypothetical protein